MSHVRPPTRRAPALHLLLVLAPAVLAAGCGKRPTDVVGDVDRSVRSWSQSVRLGSEQWADGRVPDAYLRQLLDAADEGLDKNRSSLSDVPAADSRRQGLERRIVEVRGTVRKLADALARSDHDGARDGGHAG